MNKLKGTITDVQSHEGISLVAVLANDISFTSIVLDTPETANYLKVGNHITILFKETEVIIAKSTELTISVRNQLPCTIQSINEGVLLSQINLMAGTTSIKSIITSNACKQLQLKNADSVIALIKTNEISLSPDD